MNHEDYAFKEPKKLSQQAELELSEIRCVKDLDAGSKLFRKFNDKYFNEIKDREHDLSQNASNFVFLTGLYLTGDEEALRWLRPYSIRPGFSIKKEYGKEVFKMDHRITMDVFHNQMSLVV